METLIKKGAEENTCSCCGSSVDAKPCRKFFSKVAEQEYSLYHCSECDLMFWMPLKIRPELYDNQAFGYIDFHYGLRKKLPYYSKAFFENIPLKRGLLLDVGGGEGLFSVEAAKKGFDTYMLDFDKKSIEMARTMGVTNAFTGSLDDFLEYCKQKNIKFDVITFFEVIEHQDNLQPFINAVQQILKPSGWIAGSTPNRERAFAEITRTSDGQDTPPHHFFWWNKKSLKNFFQLNNFEIEIFPTKVSLEDATAHLIDILLGNTIKKLKNRIVANKQKNIETANTEKIKRSQKIVLSFMRHIRHISLLPFGVILKFIYEKKGGVSFYFQGQKTNCIHHRKYNRCVE
ncbi:MAG: class I SAM-dependent methyltransferase [Actinobacteria bacterium]|nr:class I SAM-dependent methyltransferase [Actinomycetota bacterium]